ncbi:MAG: Maf family protein [Trueperaceae bacterium]|nr:Maf family protein [Trueperaceae bacterium]
MSHPRPTDAARVVLASASPRRRELLASLGVTFEVVRPAVDEHPLAGEGPAELAVRLARAKAAGAAEEAPAALVIAADTVVALGDEPLGKPRDAEENRTYLRRLAGVRHVVVTGHCLRLGGREETVAVRTAVTMRVLSEAEIELYLASGDGLDKAGGYAIQNDGGALVGRIEGCYTNVVGLSLPAVVEVAARLGVPLV